VNYEALEQLNRDRRDALQRAAAARRLASVARRRDRQRRRLLADLELPLLRRRRADGLRPIA
jgi:hypothetical protein